MAIKKDQGTPIRRRTVILILKRDNECPALPAGLCYLYRQKRFSVWSRSCFPNGLLVSQGDWQPQPAGSGWSLWDTGTPLPQRQRQRQQRCLDWQ